jgi:hypothetical protein
MVCEVRGLRWCLLFLAGFSVCAVNPAEVVVRHKQGGRMTMVLNRFAITQTQTRETSIEQTSGQIQTLCMARIDFAPVQ